MHPNAQRLFGEKARTQVASYIGSASQVGLSFLQELRADQWDSLEQWFRISFPHILDAIKLQTKRQAAAV